MSEAYQIPEQESSSPSSTDGRNELAEKIAEMLNLPDARLIILGAMAGFDITKKETALIVYDGGQTEYLIQRFLVAKKVAGRGDRTCKLYGDNLRRFFKAAGKSPVQLEHTDVQWYVAQLIMRGVSKDYQQNIVRTLSSFYGWLTKEELVERNIMLKIDPIKNKAKKKKAFDEMEVEKIRMACRSRRETCLVEVMLSTACRVFEVASLRIDMVIGKDEVTIIGKGDKQRTVYLNAKAKLSIEAYLKERKDKNPYLFPASIMNGQDVMKHSFRLKNGENWYMLPEQVSETEHTDNSVLESIVRGIGKRAGVTKCHPHRFRRTAATFALRRGMNIMQVKEMLGHESLETTQRYLDITEDEVKEAHKRFMS